MIRIVVPIAPTSGAVETGETRPPALAAPAASSPPKLLDRVRWHLRVKHYSLRTEQLYLHWIRRYILFHGKRHPDEMGA